MLQVWGGRCIAVVALVGLMAGVSFGGVAGAEDGTGIGERTSPVSAILGVLAVVEEVEVRPLRDLFHKPPPPKRPAPRGAQPAQEAPATKKPNIKQKSEPEQKPKPEPEPEPEPKLESDLEPDPGQPRLIGIVISDHIRAAYFMGDGDGQSLIEGESLNGQYQVMRIEPERVLLRDLSTGLMQAIDWSGER